MRFPPQSPEAAAKGSASVQEVNVTLWTLTSAIRQSDLPTPDVRTVSYVLFSVVTHAGGTCGEALGEFLGGKH